MNRFKHFKYLVYSLVVFSLISKTSQAQLKPGTYWLTLKTPHFDVVTPKEALQKGQETANMLEYLYKSFGPTLHSTLQRWTVKINNQLSTPNGFVTAAPRYSEFFLSQASMTLPYPNYEEDFIYSLATHESRHMAQMSKLFEGFNRFWYFLGGENLQETMWNLTIPGWFWEGDAVNFETLHSTAGRGRTPSFLYITKARILSGKPLTYYQALFGSYIKSDAGDPYLNGYPLVSYLKRTYGDDVLGRVMDKKNTFIGQLPFGYRYAIRKVTGKSILQIYKDSNDSMKTAWQRQLQGLDTTSVQVIAPPKTEYQALYFSPQWIDSQTIAFFSSRTDDVPTIESVKINGEYNEISKGITMYPWFSFNSSNLIFASPRRHTRFENEYSEIFNLNIQTKKITKLTYTTRLFTPVLSPDGNRFAALSIDSSGKSSVQIYDISTKKSIKQHAIPNFHSPSSLVWDKETKDIFYIVNTPDGDGVIQWNPDKDTSNFVLPPRSVRMACLEIYHNRLLFTSQQSGIDNIYAYDMANGKEYQVTSRPYGTSFSAVSPDGKYIALIDFTGVHGTAVAIIPFAPDTWKEIDSIQKRPVCFYNTDVDSHPLHSFKEFTETKQVDFPVNNYKPIKNLINIHSWQTGISPFFLFDGTSLLGLNIQSKSIFNDWQWDISSSYIPDADIATGGPSITCTKYWPVISLSGYISRNNIFRNSDYFSSQFLGNAGLSLPFSFKTPRSSQYLNLGAIAAPKIDLDRSLRRINNSALLDAIYYSRFELQKSAPRINMNGYYGLDGQISFSNTPYTRNNLYKGTDFTVDFHSSLPGFAPKDNWVISAGYHKSSRLFFTWEDLAHYPRGISIDSSSAKNRLYGSINYLAPLWFPDLAIGPIAYFHRIAATMFIDANIDMREDLPSKSFFDRKKTYSGGVQFTADFIPFNIDLYPVTMGIRLAAGKDISGDFSFRPEFISSMDILGAPVSNKSLSSGRKTDHYNRSTSIGRYAGSHYGD